MIFHLVMEETGKGQKLSALKQHFSQLTLQSQTLEVQAVLLDPGYYG